MSNPTDAAILVEGWRSKAKWPGTAHFVLASGETACAAARGPYGILMKDLFDLFKTEWRELDATDHLCRLCTKYQPRACACGRCSVRPSAKGVA